MEQQRGRVAFALGGGGVLGAHEVGMLQALFEADVRPDLVVGTSVGAINGAMVAADPDEDAIRRLAQLWTKIGRADVFGGSLAARVGTLVRSGTHLHDNASLRQLLTTHLPVAQFEDLVVPFQCVAASIQQAGAHWFSTGSLVDAVLASSAVPGLLPPVEIDGEHFLDGGLVHSIPVGRAVSLGATEVYVLQVGRVEEPLTPPTGPLQVGVVAFEIARRHRFVEEMRQLPADVTVHVLPSGDPPKADLSQLRYRDFSKVGDRIRRAYEASAEYLREQAR
ncbi:MAG TPA: patatin-like phospholipase family protein [Egibacteraceae bacterium]|nr:patatin-like phospholipase family protein [Egibacteraceae bacterium]